MEPLSSRNQEAVVPVFVASGDLLTFDFDLVVSLLFSFPLFGRMIFFKIACQKEKLVGTPS